MKKIIDKIAGGIVNHHNILLIFMMILTLGAGLLTLQVNVNADMTQYLPDDSTMKQGIDLMEAEFPDLEQDQTIRVMFKGLSDTEKTAIATELSQIDYVDHVDFEVGDEAYDKGDYTLYIVNTTYDYGTQEEHAIERAIADQYSQKEPDIVNDSADGELPLWVALLAFAILLVILLIMCASWVEPFLFLVAIGMAVVLNMGTNAIFESVSKTTFQIAAILQLVLSMDYSIILMNRFRQESLKRDDKYEAMKHALSNAFSSIGSSAMTTIVGLLMLVFMSFKIGADLGLVLAKGVALSLVTVFTVLPVLILFADGLIKKTSKKSLHVNMTKIAAFSYRFRKGIAVVFFVLLIGSFFLKNITQMTFTMSKEDPIADVFQKSNPIVMLYNNEDEDQLSNLINEIEDNPYVKDVSTYQTTLGKAYKVDDLVREMADSDSDFSFEPDMLKILYYDYYEAGKTYAMTMTDFLNFLSEDVKNNPQFSDRLDDDMKANLDQLSTFTDKETLTKPLSAEALANQFGMDAEDIGQLFMLYFSQKGGIDSGQMTLSQLTDFIVNDLANDPQYGTMFDAQTLSQMKSLINTAVANRALSSDQSARLLGMDQQEAQSIYLLKQLKEGTTESWTLSIENFVNFILDDVASQEAYADQFDQETLEELQQAQVIIEAVIDGKLYTSEEMASLLEGMSEDLTDNNMNLMYLYKSSLDHGQPEWTMTIEDLFAYLDDRVIDDPRFAEMISDQDRQDLLEMKEEIDDGLEQLVGPHYSIMMIDTTLPDESSETTAFVNQLSSLSDQDLTGDYYLIGNSPMSVEMAGSFGSEMTMITILTALAIFIVVAITFRSLTIPLALVLIVQCGVFITITSSGLREIGIYYLASLIVQCILMGATIDYGILFSSYYRENRHEKGLKESLISAYEGSIHTIMTSGSVMVFVLGIIGIVPTDPSIQTICQTLAVGTLTAIILILFVLPGLLASFDKWIAGKGVYKEMTNKGK